MPALPNETLLEEYIVRELCSRPIVDANGRETSEMEYRQLSPDTYDRDLCLIPSELFVFLKETQPEEYQKIVDAKDGDEAAARRNILNRLKSDWDKALRSATKDDVNNQKDMPQGTLSLLRRRTPSEGGAGSKFYLTFFKPANDHTPEHDVWYRANRLAVVRQLRYSNKNNNEIDLAIFLNGFPVATLELKNAFTGQNHHNAIKQYMEDRPIEGEPLLQFKRCIVHFAVGTEQVFMTTRLNGDKTKFFPFNKTLENEGLESASGCRTEYLWNDVLRRDNLLDLIQNFITLQVSVDKVYDPQKRAIVDAKPSEALIFPRYHQRRAVHRLVDDIRERGAGHKYLIQHSAGSGKSNTIAWLAFRLSNLFQHPTDLRALFDSIIIVTDRRVLNEQLSRNVKQFSDVPGEVFLVNDSKGADGHTSKDLCKAIEQGYRIIVTTIQKFPYISDAITLFPDRKYAIIIDEAHSSQSGDNARQMRKALSLKEAEDFDKEEEEEKDEETLLNERIEMLAHQKGNKSNISFFAFTATPKPKTIELFCERENGTKEPFDCYTMEEAIKEGFILDVLQGYMSFARYYKLVRNESFKDKEYDRKKSIKLLTSYVDLQDAAIEKKARIMIEHFASQTQQELDGAARAMLVTRSRLHAVRFKRKFDEIMQEMRLPYKSLVTFSGTVKDAETGEEYTEEKMNNLEGNISIPQALKMPQYRILIVANKYQTGFDEPLLHTMFVDKMLGGANAVQTLSRLNRRTKGKNETMVLDFVNDPEKIRESFQEFYNKTKMLETDETDPNSLYDVKSNLEQFNVYTQADVDEFAKIFFVKGDTDKAKLMKLNAVCDRVCDRTKRQLDKDNIDKLRKTCASFTKLYTFLSQIITFVDVELEKLSAFTYALSKKLPHVTEALPYDVLKESELDSYKIKYLGRTKLSLESGDNEVAGMKPGQAQGTEEPDFDFLSNIIKILNETFGIDLSEEDRLDIQRMRDRIASNETLLAFFNPNNSRDDIRSRFNEEVDSELLDFINGKVELYNKLTDINVNEMLKRLWFNDLYDTRVRGLR